MYKGATIYIYLYERMPPTPSRFIHIISTASPQEPHSFPTRYPQDTHRPGVLYPQIYPHVYPQDIKRRELKAGKRG
jgi:hypothetical protein